jgi:c-di-GMP-binding flagellar brake protein YcgR
MTEAQTLEPGQLPPRHELVEPEEFGQYVLHSRTEILAVLRSVTKSGVMITVQFDEGQSFILSLMRAVLPDNDSFVIEMGKNEAMNARAAVAKPLVLTALLDRVKIQFEVEHLRAVKYEGRPALAGPIPKQLLRLQRREFYRLATPIANPIRVCTTIPHPLLGPTAVELPLLDISGGGVCLMLTPSQASLLKTGQKLANCRFMLPGEGLLVASLCVRSFFDVATRTGGRFFRVGCEFVDLTGTRLAIVQRYITRIERERKARLSGMG